MHDLTAMVATHGVLLVFAVTLAARLGMPIPAVPVLIVAGSLHVRGVGSLAAVLAAAVAGSTAADAAWFAAGRRYGYRVLRLLCKISISPDSCVSQSESFFKRWGGGSLIASKFLPGVSVVAPPLAGALQMPVTAFLEYELIASTVWALLFLGVGMLFSNQVQAVADALSTMGAAALGVLALALVVYIGWRLWRRRQLIAAAEVPRITVADLLGFAAAGVTPVIVDVRSDIARSTDTRRIPGALAVELRRVRQLARELARDRPVVLYCSCPNEVTAVAAAKILARLGFAQAHPLSGGLDAWIGAGHPIDHHALPPVVVSTGRSNTVAFWNVLRRLTTRARSGRAGSVAAVPCSAAASPEHCAGADAGADAVGDHGPRDHGFDAIDGGMRGAALKPAVNAATGHAHAR